MYNESVRKNSESIGYFPVPGAHLYTVLHEVRNPVARVLLVGPFASERQNTYIPWVRWARYLAARGIEVLRYDYRGIGESTGEFAQMTFDDWSQDVQLLSEWLAARPQPSPLMLHGLAMGAVLAGRAFDAGIGDWLLLWSPPESANQVLRSSLARWMGLEQIFKFGSDRKPISAFVSDLESGLSLEVEGYQWSARLWRESQSIAMPDCLTSAEKAAAKFERPVRIERLGKEAAPLAKGGSVGYDDLKDFTWLFEPNYAWLTEAAAQRTKEEAYV